MSKWMYAHSLPADMHPEGCTCGGCGGGFDEDDLADMAQMRAEIVADELRRDYERDTRLAQILNVDVDIVVALLPDDDIVPDELWRQALEQVRQEGL